MSSRLVFFLSWFLLLSLSAAEASIQLGTGAALFNRKVQSREEADKNQSPTPEFFILLGARFRLYRSILAAPELGYQFNRQGAEDSYGGDASIKTFLLRYHALYPLGGAGFSSSMLALRFGATTFIRSTKGKGGSVEVPNGSSTMTAFRPSEKSTSYTAGPALGVDYIVQRPLFYGTRSFSLGALLEVPQFLSKERRIWGLSFLLSVGI